MGREGTKGGEGEGPERGWVVHHGAHHLSSSPGVHRVMN